jgi:hypothetical protein
MQGCNLELDTSAAMAAMTHQRTNRIPNSSTTLGCLNSEQSSSNNQPNHKTKLIVSALCNSDLNWILLLLTSKWQPVQQGVLFATAPSSTLLPVPLPTTLEQR